MTRKTFVVNLLVLTLLALPMFVIAAGLVPTDCQGAQAAKDCGLSDLKTLIIYMINFLLVSSGMVALLFLVVGGVQMLMSGGNPESIKKGKATISNAVLGLGIVLASYLIINIVVSQLSGGSLPGFQGIFQFWG